MDEQLFLDVSSWVSSAVSFKSVSHVILQVLGKIAKEVYVAASSLKSVTKLSRVLREDGR